MSRTLAALVVLGAVLGGALWWWQAGAPTPLQASPTAALPAGPARLHVVAPGPPPFVAEALLATGVRELAVGPAPAAPPEVAVLATARSCGSPGQRRLVLLPCPSVLAAHGLPAPRPISAMAAEPLPLPEVANGWSREGLPAGAMVLLGTAEAAVAVRVGDDVVLSFPLSPFLRRLRQGDPARAGQDTDGLHGPKPNDLAPFHGDAASWARAGADRWARWLQDQLGPDWPREPTLPAGAPTVLVLTFDQDFAPVDWIDPLLARVEQAGGTATLLRTDTTRQGRADPVDAIGPPLPADALARWRRAGHGIGVHPNVVDLPEDRWPEAVRAQVARSDGPRAVRHHFLRWWGSSEPLALHAELGLWIDLDFVSLDPRFDGPGFGFGGTLPMRFQAGDGALVPVLVQPTVLEDDVLLAGFPYSHGLTMDQAVAALGPVFDEAAAVGGPVVVNLHPMLEVKHGARLLQALLDEATRRGAPIWSAERWAAFTWDRLARQGLR